MSLFRNKQASPAEMAEKFGAAYTLMSCACYPAKPSPVRWFCLWPVRGYRMVCGGCGFDVVHRSQYAAEDAR